MVDMFLMNKTRITPPPGRHLIRASEYGQLVEANRILAAARQKASETIALAMEIYEARKKQGYEDGMEAGRLQHAEKIMDTTLLAVNYLESIEKSIAGLVMQCLEKVIGEMNDKDLVLRVVKSGLAVARNEKRVVVRVCPDDLTYVQDATATLLQAYPGISILDITADNRLGRGACLIESELGLVDAGLNTQIEAIRRAISKRL